MQQVVYLKSLTTWRPPSHFCYGRAAGMNSERANEWERERELLIDGQWWHCLHHSLLFLSHFISYEWKIQVEQTDHRFDRVSLSLSHSLSFPVHYDHNSITLSLSPRYFSSMLVTNSPNDEPLDKRRRNITATGWITSFWGPFYLAFTCFPIYRPESGLTFSCSSIDQNKW